MRYQRQRSYAGLAFASWGKAHAFPCLLYKIVDKSALQQRLLVNKSCCALQEFSKHDEQPSKYLKSYTGHNPKTGQDFTCDVAYERFLGPELFFQPEIHSSDYTTPLPQV